MKQVCPVVALARKGKFGADFSKRPCDPREGGPQCDACDVLECLLSEIVQLTPHSMESSDKDYLRQHGERNILQDAVFGFLNRVRTRCIHRPCSEIRDSLHNRELVLKLSFPVQHSSVDTSGLSMSLEELWVLHFGEVEAHIESPCATCGQPAVRQNFLEGEPPLLIIQLVRSVKNREGVARKIHTRVHFPESLSFMRTGPYALCGVVLHDGPEVHEGHYTAYCRMNEIGAATVPGQCDYCFFPCTYSGPSEIRSWKDLSAPSTQSQVYILMYARIPSEFPGSAAGTIVAGSLETPYDRGVDSQALVARCLLPGGRDDGGRAMSHGVCSCMASLSSVACLFIIAG